MSTARDEALMYKRMVSTADRLFGVRVGVGYAVNREVCGALTTETSQEVFQVTHRSSIDPGGVISEAVRQGTWFAVWE